MNIVHTHIVSAANIDNVTLSPTVEYQVRDNQLMFYNTAFDSVFILQAKSNRHCNHFAHELEVGTPSIKSLVAECFNMNPDDIIVAMFQKHIIE